MVQCKSDSDLNIIYDELANKTIERINDNTYIELVITNHNNVADIENAFYVDLEKSANESYYLCPFNSISDLRNHMNETYTDNQIDFMLSYIPIIEHNDSLYISDLGKVFSDRVPLNVSIIEETDTNIDFSIEYDIFIDEITLVVNYRAKYENGKWLLDSKIET